MIRLTKLDNIFRISENQIASPTKSGPTSERLNKADDFISDDQKIELNDSKSIFHQFTQTMQLTMQERIMLKVNPDKMELFTDFDQLRLSDYFSQFQNKAEIYILKERKIPLPNTNYIMNGWFMMKLPFKQDQDLVKRFCNVEGNRVLEGKLIELLDFCAGISTFNYNIMAVKQNVAFVTASMDNVRIFSPIPTDDDLFIQAYPTYVGNTSIEIRIDLFCDFVHNSEVKRVLYGCAHFFMVARTVPPQKGDENLNTASFGNYKETYQVPKLNLEGDNETERENNVLRNEMGQLQNMHRQKKKNLSVFQSQPTAEQSKELHELFLEHRQKQNLVQQTPISTSKEPIEIESVKMKKTITQKQNYIHFQDQNVYEKVFGGVVLRQAWDLALVTVQIFTKGDHVQLYHIDDVSFHFGVDVGSTVTYTAYISYVRECFIHVQVKVQRNDLQNQTCLLATELHLTFLSTQKQPNILPISYEECLDYLEGRKRVQYLGGSY